MGTPRRQVWSIVVPIAAGLCLSSCAWLERITETVGNNHVRGGQPPPCADGEACAGLEDLFIADLHADTLLWGRDPRRAVEHGQVDLARLLEGGVDLQVFAMPSQTPGEDEKDNGEVCVDRDGFNLSALPFLFNRFWDVPTWFSNKARIRAQVGRFDRMVEPAEGPRFMAIRSVADLDALRDQRAAGEPVVGALLAVEGIHWVGGADAEIREEIRVLYEKGLRMIALTHRFTNDLAGSSEDCTAWPGLTPAGEAALGAVWEQGLILDLAHASPAAIEEATDMALAGDPTPRAPIVVSHGGINHDGCETPRNIGKEDLRRIVRAGGLVGIGYWPEVICWEADDGLEQIMEKIVGAFEAAYGYLSEDGFAAEMRGRLSPYPYDPADYLVLGSDFDGAVTVPFDTARVPRFLQALKDAETGSGARLLTPAQLAKIAGGNVERFLRCALPRDEATPATCAEPWATHFR